MLSAALGSPDRATLATVLEVEDALTAVEKVVAEADMGPAWEEPLECIFVCAVLTAWTLEVEEGIAVDEARTETEAGFLDGTLEDEALVVAPLVSTPEVARIPVETTLEDTAAEEETLAAPSMFIQAKDICLVVEEGRLPY